MNTYVFKIIDNGGQCCCFIHMEGMDKESAMEKAHVWAGRTVQYRNLQFHQQTSFNSREEMKAYRKARG